MGQHWPDGYSAHVDVYLLIDGERLNVAQIGNGSLVLRDARVIPPSTMATLVLQVDGREKTKEILLRDGATHSEQRLAYF